MKSHQLFSFLLLIAAVVFCVAVVRHSAPSILSDKPLIEFEEEVADSDLSDGFSAERSGKWPTVRKNYITKHPECEACCGAENLNVHHVVPFHDDPSLELDESNLITLCRDCHFRLGHDPDGPSGPEKPNWKKSNPNVRRDAAEYGKQ